MGYKEFMQKLRYLDNKTANWMMRHFYLLFFQAILIVVFLILFVNVLKVIDLSTAVSGSNMVEQLLLTQCISTLIIVLLLLFNSFWMLYILNSILRVRTLLKDVSYHLSRVRSNR